MTTWVGGDEARGWGQGAGRSAGQATSLDSRPASRYSPGTPVSWCAARPVGDFSYPADTQGPRLNGTG